MKYVASQVYLDDALSSAQELLALQRFEEACLTLRHALPRALELNEVPRVLAFVKAVPTEVLGLASWVELRVRLAGSANQPEQVLAVVESLELGLQERFQSYVAWAYVRLRRFEEALRLTETLNSAAIEPGLWWRSRAEALAYLGDLGWREAFAQARSYLHGVPLGLCIREEGVLSAWKGDFVGARAMLAEAFSLLRQHPYEAAWTKYNQGIVALNVLLPEAEKHFLEMLQLVKTPAARAFEARGLCGLGASRRALGEFERAISAYEQARRCAMRTQDKDVLCQSWFGLGHTRRVSGQLTHALEALHTAAALDPDATHGSSFVHASLAATYLQLGNDVAVNRAVEHAERAVGISLEHRERLAVVRAERYRLRKETNKALAALTGLTLNALWVREERVCFPELFALLESVRGASVEPLPLLENTVVEVRARGSLRVLVNDRDVLIAPTGRVGQVLVLLLEAGLEASVESLLLKLYPDLNRMQHRGKAQLLSGFIVNLRHALGWAGSVRALGGAYRLDETVNWKYDIAQARTANKPVERFLEGVYAEWAVELAHELSQVKQT